MTGEVVLITGTSGHVGFRVLRYALEFGYHVKAAVRSEAKAETVRSNPVLKAMNKDDHLSFVIVPDIVSDHAFDEAVKGVTYIIHVASPLGTSDPNCDFQKVVVDPAVRGTMNMLEAARQVDTVRRIVITSSVAAITPFEVISGATNKVDRINAESRVPSPTSPPHNPMSAYHASKVTSLNKAEAWIREEKPGFDLIHIHPAYVEGRNDLTLSLEEFMAGGTNRIPLRIALGMKSEPTIITVNHLDDTAWVHVKALDPSIEGNQSFLITSRGDDGLEWNQVKDIVAKHFPDAVREGILPNNGDTPSYGYPHDSTKTEQTFGFKLASFESQVVSVIGHYLEIYRKEKGGSKD